MERTQSGAHISEERECLEEFVSASTDFSPGLPESAQVRLANDVTATPLVPLVKPGVTGRISTAVKGALRDHVLTTNVTETVYANPLYRDPFPRQVVRQVPSKIGELYEAAPSSLKPAFALFLAVSLANTVVPSFSTLDSTDPIAQQTAPKSHSSFELQRGMRDSSSLNACYTLCTNPLTWQYHFSPECQSQSSALKVAHSDLADLERQIDAL